MGREKRMLNWIASDESSQRRTVWALQRRSVRAIVNFLT